jgi:signal transduction histidine kinase
MKLSIFTKLIACYIFILVAPFIIIETLGAFTLRAAIMEDHKSSLYNEANILSRELLTNHFKEPASLYALKAQLDIISKLHNVLILIIDENGDILLNTQQNRVNRRAFNVNELSQEMNQDLLTNTFTENVTIPKLINNESLCVSIPLSDHLEAQGYLMIASPMLAIENQYEESLTALKYFFIPIALVSFTVFFLIYLFMVRPLNKVITAAMNYAAGDYDYRITFHSKDEFQTLFKTLSYMAGEMNNLENYRKNFIANISHDFRSPLTSIKGYIEAILDGTIPNESKDKYLNIILSETERLTKLTGDLLELNEFEHKWMGYDITVFDINTIIQKMAASLEGVCINRRLCLAFDFGEDEILVEADIGKIQQVLHNLLDNAIKFSHNDSTIWITTSAKGEKAFVSVKDYGVGIPDDAILHIWERFYKIDPSRGKDKKGTGLGLSIAREIIHAHGENINVVSTQGAGSEFIFSLPLNKKT